MNLDAKNVTTNEVKPVEGDMVVSKSEARKLLKESNNKVSNGNIDAFVCLKDINKIYPNGVQAVYDFNIDIKEHDFIVLVGPSGCGKSTTLRMVAGLEDITSGYLYINKVLSNYLPSKDRDISMVFQSYALYPQMTVYDNIAFPLRSRKYTKPVVAQKAKVRADVDKTLEHIDDFLAAHEEAKERDIRKALVPQFIGIKLGIDKEAAKILLKYSIADKNSLDAKAGENELSLREKILAESKKVSEEDIASLNKKGYEVNDEFACMLDGKPVLTKRKLTEEEIREKVFNAARILDLGPYLDRRPKELSGGQMQRVALGRAIVRDARLFLMDEPLSNLDAKLRVAMRSEIVRIHEQIGATTIYVTHDQTEAMTMATKIAVMSKGWVQQIGEPQEIYARPRNIFVATFIGAPAMNIFEGHYDKGLLTFQNGYSVQLDKNFVKLHDKFYKEKIEDIERILSLDEFKKMHALSSVDDGIAQLDAFAHKNDVKKHISEVAKFVDQLQFARKEEVQKLLSDSIANFEKADEVVANIQKAKAIFEEGHNTRGVQYASDILQMIDDLPTVDEMEGIIKEIEEVAKTITDEHGAAILNAVKAFSAQHQTITEADYKELKGVLHSIRQHCLTISSISSSDLGKLHNAQVFNKNEKRTEDSMFYDKKKKKTSKKTKIKVSSNSTFINNLYDVAAQLLEDYKKAFVGPHDIRIGVRPEDIHLDEEFAGKNKTTAFETFTDVVELMGSELLIHTSWNNSDMIAKIATGTIVKPHTDVKLTMNADKILVFDVSSGDTILR